MGFGARAPGCGCRAQVLGRLRAYGFRALGVGDWTLGFIVQGLLAMDRLNFVFSLCYGILWAGGYFPVA